MSESASIPKGGEVPWQALVDFRRNHVSENTIHGAIAWVSGDRVIHGFGGDPVFYGRSTMKRFTSRSSRKSLRR